MLFTISRTVTSITTFSVMKKLKKSQAELRQHYPQAQIILQILRAHLK
jgi:hypothetical protein